MTLDAWIRKSSCVLQRARVLREGLLEKALTAAMKDEDFASRRYLKAANRVMPVAERYVMELRNR